MRRDTTTIKRNDLMIQVLKKVFEHNNLRVDIHNTTSIRDTKYKLHTIHGEGIQLQYNTLTEMYILSYKEINIITRDIKEIDIYIYLNIIQRIKGEQE